MYAYRKKPVIGKANSAVYHPKTDDDPMFCLWFPLVAVISYFVLSAISRVTTSSGSKLDQIVCFGALICFVVIMLVGAIDTARDKKVKAAERQRWKDACVSAELTIINRHERGSFDDGYRSHSVPCRLELETNSDQRANFPNLTIVSVAVSDIVYQRLEKRNTVRIYYRPVSPMTFMLEDEL